MARDLVLLGSRETRNGAESTQSGKIEKFRATDPAVTRAAEISDDDLPF